MKSLTRVIAMLCATLGLIVNPAVANAKPISPAYDPPSYPSCGDSIVFSGVQYSYSSQTISFKIVAVDVGQWFTGYGLMDSVVTDVFGSHPEGPWNVSSYSGGRSPVLAFPAPLNHPYVDVNVWLEKNGSVYCRTRQRIS